MKLDHTKSDSQGPREDRRCVCYVCGRSGIHVDTTAGEIVIDGATVSVAPRGARLLMTRDDGELVCDDCAADAAVAYYENRAEGLRG